MPAAASVSDYIARCPPKARKALRQLRRAIRAAAPGMTERISYRIPTFDLDGRYLLYIAAFEAHVSVYPVTAGMVGKHGSAIARYRAGKGTLRFPLDEPIPAALVTKLAKVRVQERRATGRPGLRHRPAAPRSSPRARTPYGGAAASPKRRP
jgi:uncharacterized protein YdhG (YjbR/CyaY superfamily)